MKTTDRPQIVLWATGAVVIVAAIVAVALASQPESLDPSTPEGTVQRYVQLLIEGRPDQALELVEPSDDCTDSGDFRPASDPARDLRVGLRTTRIDGDRATVEVEITESHGSGPFDLGESRYGGTFVLDASSGEWLIQAAPWPFAKACLEVTP